MNVETPISIDSAIKLLEANDYVVLAPISPEKHETITKFLDQYNAETEEFLNKFKSQRQLQNGE